MMGECCQLFAHPHKGFITWKWFGNVNLIVPEDKVFAHGLLFIGPDTMYSHLCWCITKHLKVPSEMFVLFVLMPIGVNGTKPYCECEYEQDPYDFEYHCGGLPYFQ